MRPHIDIVTVFKIKCKMWTLMHHIFPMLGSGRTLTRCVVEIIDSDDEFVFAPRGNLSGNELNSQS